MYRWIDADVRIDKLTKKVLVIIEDGNLLLNIEKGERQAMSKTANKWNCNLHRYETCEIPEGASIYETDLSTPIECAACGKEIPYGESYTSMEIHTPSGLGYGVCHDCYLREIRRREDNNG